MKDKIRRIKEEVVTRAGQTFASAVRAAMNLERATADAQKVREKYRGLPSDALADILIKRAARKTKWEGAANGLGVTGFEVVVVAPAPEPSHKVAVSAGVVALLLADLAYATRVQMQLLLAIAELYSCPFDGDDEEDIYTVFKAALGLKGTELVGSYSQFIFTKAARKQFRKLLRTGIRRGVQDWVIKIAGPKIGRYLGEKYVMRLVPVVNVGLGYAFNNRVTKSVGKWAKVKAKVRSSAFKQVKRIQEEEPEALVWVLPVIFHVGTADDMLTDNELTIYSQINKRLPLNEEQLRRVELLNNDENLPNIFAEELQQIGSEKARKALYDVAVTTAAVNLNPQKEHEDCLAELARCLKIEYSELDLKERGRYLMH